MKLNKTLKIKIGKISNNKKNIINRLLRKNIKAINFCLNKAKKGKKITHKLVYKDLRKLNLPATIINNCRAKSIEIYKSYRKRKGKKTFPILKNSKIRYDNTVTKLRKTENKLYPNFISLLYKATISGKKGARIELPLITNSNYQKEIIKEIGNNYKLGSTELLKKDDDYFIHISYSKEVNIPEVNKSFNPIGIDIGINNLAVSVAQKSVKFHTGRRIGWKNEFFRKERARLQSNFAFKELHRLRDRQRIYNNHSINVISKQIVEQAKTEKKPVIVMENLTNILKTAKVSKKQRVRLHSWFFKRLQKAIEYKANWEEIPVFYIDPYHTSKTCSKCGTINNRYKHYYKCKNCGIELNADYNAGRNIKQFFKAICPEEKATINLASNLIIPEATKLKKDNLVRNTLIPPRVKTQGILKVIL